MLLPTSRIVLLGTGLLSLLSFTTNVSQFDDGPSLALTPAQEKATFQVEPGLQVQLVAAEPMVQAPVGMTFDADGRLWVVEMRGFMTTIDGAEENKPLGRVSVLEDRNGDGQMDVSTVYLDSLIMPRALAFAPGGVLVAESGALWLTKDQNGDLKADSKTLVDKDYAASGLPEHAPNGLWRGMDNWYYNAKAKFRYRFRTDGTWQKDSTEFRGQWGISHDDKGRLIYNYNWSQLHGDLVPPNSLSRNKHHAPSSGIDHGLTIDRRIYPVRSTPAVNRGYIPGTLDKNGRIQEFTAACSPFVYRGTALPAEFQGNIFVCEPAGNLVKRNVVTEEGPILTARDPHPGREFLASTDERFRPVSIATGPDGSLYVADMYRGIIQHGAYMTPYLKEQTLARNLVQPVNRGRIWRIVPQNGKVNTPKKLSKASTDALIRELSNPDGWYRDMAQRLLVERADATAKPALVHLAQAGSNPYGRAQALWTLDGMNQSEAYMLLNLASDPQPVVRSTAMRLLEPLARTNPAIQTQLGMQLLRDAPAASAETALQMALSAQALAPAASLPVLAKLAERHGNLPLIRDAVLSSLQDREFALLKHLWQHPKWQQAEPAKEIFVEMLATAIVRKRDAGELGELLTLLDTPGKPIGWREKATLAGLSIGGSVGKQSPIRLATAPRILSQPDGAIDANRLAALTALFEWPGHEGKAAELATKPKANALTVDEQKLFAQGRQLYLATCSGCHGTDGVGMARFAPPLTKSQWVLGDGKRLALILLHGMEGPVDVAGKVYNAPDILPVMPAHSTLDDAAIAAILTYIRNEWGNQAGAVDRRTVGMTRVMSQGRVVPWTTKDLDKYMLEESKKGK